MPSRTPRPAPPRPAAAADLDDAGKQVLRQFRQVYNAVRTHFQKVEKIVGLGGSMVWALSLVRDRPGIGVRGLAEAMAVHQSTASNLVRGLLDRQLISAAKDGPDRRTVQRWCADIIRPVGPRPNPAVSDERIVYLRETEGLSYAQIAAQTALGSWTSARNRYYAAKGIPRDGRREPKA